MIDKVYLDASFLVAALIDSHPFHSRAMSLVTKLNKKTVCVSLPALDEVLHALVTDYHLSKTIILMMIQEIMTVDNLEIVGYKLDSKNAIGYVKTWAQTGLKPRDAFHLFCMQNNALSTIATFDDHFTAHQKELNIRCYT